MSDAGGVSQALLELGKVETLEEYEAAVNRIVEVAQEKTEAEVGVLFLTVDGVFLEAAAWKSGQTNRPPASELPTYRLCWLEKDDKKLDGITAYVAIHCKPLNLNSNEVFDHSAWKGRWDAVFLEGERKRCRGILAVPLQCKIGTAKSRDNRIHGVLKVENPINPDEFGCFNSEQEKRLMDFSKDIANQLNNSPSFWRNFAQARADLKVSYLSQMLERGRPIKYNLSKALGYISKLFEIWLGCNKSAHIFWRYLPAAKNAKCHILRPWDCAIADRIDVEEHAATSEKDAQKIVRWLHGISSQIVQRKKYISGDIREIIFGDNTEQSSYVDIIRLKAGNYDLGAIVLPESKLWSTYGMSNEGKGKDQKILETLTRLAINIVFVLGRFIEDEYETSLNTYLPEHRPPRTTRTCSILFADIMNFSELIQKLRLIGRPGNIEPFMHHFCEIMGNEINQTPLGRVDKFIGDGVMALYGDHLDAPDEDHIKVVVSVDCAFKMCKKFRKLYKKWVEEGLSYLETAESPRSKEDDTRCTLSDLKTKFNEDVNIDLTIGINIGEIYFDYFGDKTHREYTPIGDHVNFTHRIRGAAGQYDESERRMLSNILVSQTAYQSLRKHNYLLKKGVRNPVWLRFKGFGFKYPVYEIEYGDLDHKKVERVIRDLTSEAKKMRQL